MAVATPAHADEAPVECREEGDEIVCPAWILEELRATFLDLEELLAIERAGRIRAEGEVLLLEAHVTALGGALQAAPPRRPLLPLVPLGLAVGGGACIAADGCPPVAGWVTVGVAVLLGLVGR